MWLLDEAAYQGGEEAEEKRRETEEQLFSDKTPLIRCEETFNTWQ